MKQYKLGIFLLLATFSYLLGSCQASEKFIENINSGEGNFLISSPKQFSIEMTRSNSSSSPKWTSNNGDMTASVTETNWDNSVSMTRSNITGEEVEWEDSVRMALYISDTDGNIQKDSLKEIPINPLTHEIYKNYSLQKYSLVDQGKITPEKEKTIDGTSYFWSKWSKGNEVPAKANFYAFYPRPFDIYLGHDWEYIRNSVVDQKQISSSSSSNEWNEIPYEFWEAETRSTLNQFDLMYSVSEDEKNNEYRFGNIGKSSGDNIQMSFAHAFCLLDFHINKGDYNGEFALTNIRIAGTNVSSKGILDIKTGILKPENQNKTIDRIVTASDKDGDAYQASMIVPPVSESAVDITCSVDGVDYKCSIPKLVLESGKKYNVNLTMNAGGDIYLQVWNGAKATINGRTISGEEVKLDQQEINAGNFTVSEDNGYHLVRVLKNGKPLVEYLTDENKAETQTRSFDFEAAATGKTYYTIVALPKEWYAQTKNIRVQFDGKVNNPYKSTQDAQAILWTDLTGHGNNGELSNFASPAGWKDGKGLCFNGTTSIVEFPGTISDNDYTMEFYIFMDENQKTGGTPRLVAEGTEYPAFYFRKKDDANGTWKTGLYGQGNGDVHDFSNTTISFGKIMQLDFVYSCEKKTVTSYIIDGQTIQIDSCKVSNDAKSIPKASLGRLSANYTRALTGTYYSFILYDSALDKTAIEDNYNLNKNRFKTTSK